MKKNDKKQRIIESAKKRFSHFGIGKTTMEDIGKNLGISKALLYYYFPDKNSLYLAVVSSLLDDMLSNIESKSKGLSDVSALIEVFMKERSCFIEKHYNLISTCFSVLSDLPADLENLNKMKFNRELEVIEQILQVGMDQSEIVVEDLLEESTLFLISVSGAWFAIINNRLDSSFPPSKEDFDELYILEMKIADRFLRGLYRS